MKALLPSVAVGAVAAISLAFAASGSSFDQVDQALAADVYGGQCYTTVASGCRQVISHDEDCTFNLGSDEGCGDVQGTKADKKTEFCWNNYGTIKWCSDDQSWTCGAVIVKRDSCFTTDPTD